MTTEIQEILLDRLQMMDEKLTRIEKQIGADKEIQQAKAEREARESEVRAAIQRVLKK